MEDVNYMQVPSELVFLLLGEGDKCGKVNENLNIYKKGKKSNNKSQPNGQACQDQEKTKPAETNRQQRRLQKMQTPSGAWEKRDLMGQGQLAHA